MKLATLPALVLLTLAMLVFNACANFGTGLTGDWELVAYGDASAPSPALANIDTSVSFGFDGKFGGTVGCNSFGSDYKIEGESIQFGSFFSTLMFCDPSSAQENAVLKILSNQTLTYSMNGNQLTLTTADGVSVIVLEKK